MMNVPSGQNPFGFLDIENRTDFFLLRPLADNRPAIDERRKKQPAKKSGRSLVCKPCFTPSDEMLGVNSV